jgi:hypothetical protein
MNKFLKYFHKPIIFISLHFNKEKFNSYSLGHVVMCVILVAEAVAS